MVDRDDKTRTTGSQPALSTGETPFSAGHLVGDYVVDTLLATGGQATVYAVTHRVLGRKAALKVLKPDLARSPEMIDRFVREAKVVNQIGHPGMVNVYDIGRLADGRPYFLMDLLSGNPLDVLISRHGRFDAPQALGLALAIADALKAAHDGGVVHRDLKASNIFVLQLEPPKIKLLDFGIAKLIQPEPGTAAWTQVGQRLGSAGSMAPEQYRGVDVDHRTDIYSFGVLLFRLLTGDYPFWSDSPAELERMHLQAVPPRPSTLAPVSPMLDDVVLRCLEKSPMRRYQSIAEVITALASLDTSRTPASVRPGRAVAIHVGALLDEGDEEDDDVLEILTTVMDSAEQQLTAGGYALHSQTNKQVIGIKVLPEDVTVAAGEQRDAIEFGRVLRDELAELADGTKVGVSVCVHCDGAQVRLVGNTPTVVGGPITDSNVWAPREKPGFVATPQATGVGSIAH